MPETTPSLHPPLAPHEAMAEAARCLYCYDAPCARGCPSKVDVAAFIKKICSGNLRGSARILLEANPLAASCARVCPTDQLCLGRCVLPEMGARAIDIGGLQRFVMDRAMEAGAPEVPLAPSSRRRVSVVGAGPSGVACAVELRRRGHAVTIFDANEQPGGLATYAIAAYKITPEAAVAEVEWLREGTGFSLKLGTRVGEHITVEELEQSSDAVFLAIGLAKPMALAIPGEELPGVVDALPLIGAHRGGAALPVELEGKRVIVIGGGNTATDTAILALELGAASSTIVYRRTVAEMPAYADELTLARARGVELVFLHAPVRVDGVTRAERIVFAPQKLGEPDASGRRRPEPIEGAPQLELPCDVVVRALGQRVEPGPLQQIKGLRLYKGRVVVDEQTGQTGNPKYFAGGDCVNGGREVVHAAAEGARASRGIHSMLSALSSEEG
jgi:dihydropyrimidine dehydrogenase (NAD+) subunit PreT